VTSYLNGQSQSSSQYQSKKIYLNAVTKGHNALLSHTGKVLVTMLLEGLKSQMEMHLSDEQAGFWKDRSTTHLDSETDCIKSKAERMQHHQLLH